MNTSDTNGSAPPVDAKVSRRGLLVGSAGLLGATVLGSAMATPAVAQTSTTAGTASANGTFVIRKGALLTVDPDVGNIEDGDVYVKDGTIEAVGVGLVVPEGTEEIDASRMIVMPGMVDTHMHVWNTMMRNLLAPGYEYFPVKNALVPNMTPEGFYASGMLCYAEAIDAGITTVHNFCHNIVTRETVDADLQSALDSGIRSLFTFGRREGMPREEMIDLPLAEAVMADWFGSSSPFAGRVDFGFNTRGPNATTEEMFREEMDWAFERNLMTAVHGGQGGPSFPLQPLADWGYLGPKLLCVHFVHASPEDRALMAELGSSLSYAIHSEFRLGGRGYQAEQLVHMLNDGVNVSLSVDASSLGQFDILENMSLAYHMGIPYTGLSTEGLAPVNYPDVIKMGTINGAKALGFGDVTGSLTVGKRADIVLLRADDLNVAPYAFEFIETIVGKSARAKNVDTVIVDGRIMKRGGEIVGLDVEKIKADAAQAVRAARIGMGDIYAPTSPVIRDY